MHNSAIQSRRTRQTMAKMVGQVVRVLLITNGMNGSWAMVAGQDKQNHIIKIAEGEKGVKVGENAQVLLRRKGTTPDGRVVHGLTLHGIITSQES